MDPARFGTRALLRASGCCVEHVKGRGMCLQRVVRLDRRGLCAYHRQKYGLNKGDNSAHRIQRKIVRERRARIQARRQEYYRRNAMFAGLAVATPARSMVTPDSPEVELIQTSVTA